MASPPRAAAHSSPVEKKRGWVQWSSAEARIFFDTLNKDGRDWELILSALTAGGFSKTREQVRHYYYRSLKKVNKLLQMVGNDLKIDYKTHRTEGVRALEQFWAVKLEMCSDLATIKKEDEGEFARRLKERIIVARQNAPPSPPRGGRGKRDSSPSTGTSGSSSSSSPPRATPAPAPKQTVKFVPRYKEQAECLAREGHNPRLQLIFKASKSIGSIVAHMKRKWTSKQSGTTLTSGLRIYPTQEISQTHPGWGEQDTTPVSDIATQLTKKHGPLTLEYAWPYEWVPPSPGLPSVHPAAHRLAAVSSLQASKAPESKDKPLREERDDEVSYFSFSAENSLPSLFNAGASMPGESITNVRDEEKVAHSFYSGIEQIGTPPKGEIISKIPAAAMEPPVSLPKLPEPKNKLLMSEDSLMEFPATLSEDTLRELDGHALALTESNSLGINSNLITPSLHAGGPAAPGPSLLSSEWDVPLFDSQSGPKARPLGPGAAESPPKKKPRPKQ